MCTCILHEFAAFQGYCKSVNLVILMGNLVCLTALTVFKRRACNFIFFVACLYILGNLSLIWIRHCCRSRTAK